MVMGSQAEILTIDCTSGYLETIESRLRELEQRWSRFLPDSDLSRMNLGSGSEVAVSSDTILLVETMVEAWQLTAGRFNPTILPRLVWTGYAASKLDVQRASPLPDIDLGWGLELSAIRIDRKRQTVTLPLGMVIDPGAIGKGLAADLVVNETIRAGASGCLISLGGDISAAGASPEGAGWSVSIEDPFDQTKTICHLNINLGGVATSSTHSRTWNADGVERHHVIDPTTGSQTSTETATVTVFAQSGWAAEAHATALIIGGSGDFERYADQHQLDAVLVTAMGDILMSPSLSTSSPTSQGVSL